LIVVLLGGFTTNFIWCVILNIKNRTWHEYYTTKRDCPPSREDETIIETAIDAPSEEMAIGARTKTSPNTTERVPLLANYLFSATAGVTWYLQFFFYSMGQMRMGKYEFSSWTLHMASIIIFSSLWGIALKEWGGSSSATKRKLAIGLLMLILSTIIVGYGNYLGAQAGAN
jgi:L-rhamnose-H+ transport protein